MRVVFILSLLGLWCSFGFAQLPKDFRTEQIFLELGKTEWNPGGYTGGKWRCDLSGC